MSQWVQSKYSKDAKKLKVVAEFSDTYKVGLMHSYINLPKDEYIPCDPPERWEVCTLEVVKIDEDKNDLSSKVFQEWTYPALLHEGYCWDWSEKDPDALVIKRKVQ